MKLAPEDSILIYRLSFNTVYKTLISFVFGFKNNFPDIVIAFLHIVLHIKGLNISLIVKIGVGRTGGYFVM